MLRNALTLLLTALVLLPGAVLPVLDRDRSGDEVAVESEHRPGSCLPGHDHTVCTQVSANWALGAHPISARLPHLTHRVRPLAVTVRETPATRDEGHPSRAPPRA